MQLSEIIDIIEKTAPLVAAASWDASGVQVASFRQEVTHIAVMLDPTVESLNKALACGADFFLAHHPLSMKPRFPNKKDEYTKILSLLFSRDICLYSAHTSLDANPGGPAKWLADDLGLNSTTILEPGFEGPEGKFGFGFVGKLPQRIPYKEFSLQLARALQRDEWQVSGPMPDSVQTVACCPGSGSGLFEEALKLGADVYITGDVKYHTALDSAIAGLRLIDVGHFVLEEEMMRRFAVMLGESVTVPVTFIPGRDPLKGESTSLL